MADNTNNPLDDLLPSTPDLLSSTPDEEPTIQEQLAQQQEEEKRPSWMIEGSADYTQAQKNSSFNIGEERGVGGYAKDIGLGLLTGGASAIEGILELPTVFGLDYDIPDDFGLPQTETLAGGFADGLTNFALGFAMGGGGVGANIASKLSQGAKMSKVLGTAKAGRSWLPARASALRKGGYGKYGKGKIGNLTLREELFKASTQGIVVDMMFFKGDEARLSDLTAQFPTLANPISDFLREYETYDENGEGVEREGFHSLEVVKRLKNAVEGIGMGIMFDSLLIGLGAMARTGKAIKNGADPQEAWDVRHQAIQDMAETMNIDVKEAEATYQVGEAMGFEPHQIDFASPEDAREQFASFLYQDADGASQSSSSSAFVELAGGDTFFLKGIQQLEALRDKGGGNQSLDQSLKGIPLEEREHLHYDTAILNHRRLFAEGKVSNSELTIQQFLDSRRDLQVVDYQFSAQYKEDSNDGWTYKGFSDSDSDSVGLSSVWDITGGRAEESVTSWSHQGPYRDLSVMVGDRLGGKTVTQENIELALKADTKEHHQPHIEAKSDGTPRFEKQRGELLNKNIDDSRQLFSLQNNGDLVGWVLGMMDGHHHINNGGVSRSDMLFDRLHDQVGGSNITISRTVGTSEGKKYTIVLENTAVPTRQQRQPRPQRTIGRGRLSEAHPDSDTTDNIWTWVDLNKNNSNLRIRVLDTSHMDSGNRVEMLKEVYDIRTVDMDKGNDSFVSTANNTHNLQKRSAEGDSAFDLLGGEGDSFEQNKVKPPLFNDVSNPLEQKFLSFFRDAEYDSRNADVPNRTLAEISPFTQVEGVESRRTQSINDALWKSTPTDDQLLRLHGIAEVHEHSRKEWSLHWSEDGVPRVVKKDSQHAYIDEVMKFTGKDSSDEGFPNSLMHIRTVEVTLNTGERILLVNEIQNDWMTQHQFLLKSMKGNSESTDIVSPLTATEARGHKNPRALEVYNELQALKEDGMLMSPIGAVQFDKDLSDTVPSFTDVGGEFSASTETNTFLRMDVDEVDGRTFRGVIDGRKIELVGEDNSTTVIDGTRDEDGDFSNIDSVETGFNRVKRMYRLENNNPDGTRTRNPSRRNLRYWMSSNQDNNGVTLGQMNLEMEEAIPEALKSDFGISGTQNLRAQNSEEMSATQSSMVSIYSPEYNKHLLEKDAIEEMAVANGTASYKMWWYPDGPARFREARILAFIRKDIAENPNSPLSLEDFDVDSFIFGMERNYQIEHRALCSKLDNKPYRHRTIEGMEQFTPLGAVRGFSTFDETDGVLNLLPRGVEKIQEHLSPETLKAIENEARVIRNMHSVVSSTKDAKGWNELMSAVEDAWVVRQKTLAERQKQSKVVQELKLEEEKIKFDLDTAGDRILSYRETKRKIQEAIKTLDVFTNRGGNNYRVSEGQDDLMEIAKRLVTEVNFSSLEFSDTNAGLRTTGLPHTEEGYLAKYGERVGEQDAEAPTETIAELLTSELTVDEKLERIELLAEISRTSGGTKAEIETAREELANQLAEALDGIRDNINLEIGFLEGMVKRQTRGHSSYNLFEEKKPIYTMPIKKKWLEIAQVRTLLEVADSDTTTGIRFVTFDELAAIGTNKGVASTLYNKRVPTVLNSIMKKIFGKKWKQSDELKIIEGQPAPNKPITDDANAIFKNDEVDFVEKLEMAYQRNHADSPEASAERVALTQEIFTALDSIRPSLSVDDLKEWIAYVRRGVDGDIAPTTVTARLRKITKEAQNTAESTIKIGDKEFIISSLPLRAQNIDVIRQQASLKDGDLRLGEHIIGAYPARFGQRYKLSFISQDGTLQELVNDVEQEEILSELMGELRANHAKRGIGFRPAQDSDRGDTSSRQIGDTILFSKDAKAKLKKYKQQLFQQPREDASKTVGEQKRELSMKYTSHEHLTSLDENMSLSDAVRSMPKGVDASELNFVGINKLLKDNPKATVGEALLYFKPLKFNIRIREGLAMHGTSAEPLTFGERGTGIVERDLSDIDFDDTREVETGGYLETGANLEMREMSPSETLRGKEMRDFKSLRMSMADMELYDHGSSYHFDGEVGNAGELRFGTFDGPHGKTLGIFGVQSDWLNKFMKDKVLGDIEDVKLAQKFLESDAEAKVTELESQLETATKKQKGKIQNRVQQLQGKIRRAKALIADEEADTRVPRHPFQGKTGPESKKVFYRNLARIIVKYAKDEGFDSIRVGTWQENNTVMAVYTDKILDYDIFLTELKKVGANIGLVEADHVKTPKVSYEEHALEILDDAFGPAGTHSVKHVKINDGYVSIKKMPSGEYSLVDVVFKRKNKQIQHDTKPLVYSTADTLDELKSLVSSKMQKYGTETIDTIDEGARTLNITKEAVTFLDTETQPFFQQPSKTFAKRQTKIKEAMDKGFKSTDDEVLKHVLKSELQERVASMGGDFSSSNNKDELIAIFRKLVAEKGINDKSRSVHSLKASSSPSEVKEVFPLLTREERKVVNELFGKAQEDRDSILTIEGEFKQVANLTERAHEMYRVTGDTSESLKIADEILSDIDLETKDYLKELLGLGKDVEVKNFHLVKGFKDTELLAKLTKRAEDNNKIIEALDRSYGEKYNAPMRELLSQLDSKYSKTSTSRPESEGSFDAPEVPLEQKPNPMDTAKGVTWMSEAGKMVIAGLNNPDISTAIHEMGHALRNILYRNDTPRAFSVQQKQALEKAYGVTDGDWQVKHEEKFAEDFEAYFLEGKTAVEDKTLLTIFKVLAEAIMSIYAGVKDGPNKISPEVRKVFDEQIASGAHSVDKGLTDGSSVAKSIVGERENQERPPLHQQPQDNKGMAIKYEQRLIKEYGSIEQAPPHKVRAMQRMISEHTDPLYVEYYDEAGADLWSNYDRPDEPANPRKLAREEDLRDIFTQHVRVLIEEGKMGEGAEMSHMEQRLIAEETTDFYSNIIADLDEANFEKMLMGQTEKLQSSMIEAQAIRNMTQAIGEVYKETLFEIRALQEEGKEIPSELFAEAFLLSNRMGTLLQTVEKQNALFGRGLADLRRIPDSKIDSKSITSEADLKQFGDEMSEGINKEKWIEQELSALNAGDYALMRVSLGKSKTRFGKIITELYYNALLSGPRTHTVNILSGVMNTIFLPIEKALGRTMVQGTSVKEEVSTLYHMFSQITNGLRYGFLAYRNASSQLDPRGMNTLDLEGAYKGKTSLTEAVGGNKESMGGKIVDWFYSRLNMPTRFMGGADETMKHINYASNVKAKLMQRAQNAFPNDRVAQIDFVETKFAVMTEKGQMYTAKRVYENGQDRAKEVLGDKATKTEIRKFANEFLRKNWDDDLGQVAVESRERAREATFTQANDPTLGANPISSGMQKLGAMTQRASLRMPVLRLFVPFINTPTNLLTFYLDRQLSPAFDSIKLLKSTYNKEMFGSPEEKADAIGRLMTGSALTFTALGLIGSNKLTGGGPQDPNKRKLWVDAGYQPYSILVGDRYISYARLDPWASFLGTLADLHEGLMQQDGSNIEPDMIALTEDLLSATVMAVSRNLGQKTYLQGFTRLAKVIDDPDTYGESYLQSMLAMVIPTGVHQMNQDPYWREVESLTDKFKSRLPLHSETLMPRRNLFGEPIEKPAYMGQGFTEYLSPFASSQVSDEPIKQEFYKLNHAFQPPSVTKGGLINLKEYKSKSGQTAYDRWQELHGTVKLYGKTLKETLTEVIKSPRYQQMADMNEAGDNPKAEFLRKYVSRFRAKAYRQVLKEFPTLKGNEGILRYNNNARRLGNAEKQLLDIPKFYQ